MESTSGLTVEFPAWQDGAEGERRRRARTRLPALTILYHMDSHRVGERALLSGVPEGGSARLSRLEPSFTLPHRNDPRPLEDRHISRSPIVLSGSGDGGIHVSLGESRTRLVADGAPVQGSWTFAPSEVERGIVLELGQSVVLLLHTLSSTLPASSERFGLIGESEAILR
ncbi:MAG TPA: hypothetical protein VLE27_11780, partial [Thermoanaerobaculia bacterium]|nr:hypothetical protein [Thermoanaerobaculia bacterium]